MTVKAICTLDGTIGRYAEDHTKFYVGVNYVVLDAADPVVTGVTYLYGLDPTLGGAAVVADIQAQMKTFLEGQGVVFGASDSVLLLTA